MNYQSTSHTSLVKENLNLQRRKLAELTNLVTISEAKQAGTRTIVKIKRKENHSSITESISEHKSLPSLKQFKVERSGRRSLFQKTERVENNLQRSFKGM